MLSLVAFDIRGFWGSEHGMVFVLPKKKKKKLQDFDSLLHFEILKHLYIIVHHLGEQTMVIRKFSV